MGPYISTAIFIANITTSYSVVLYVHIIWWYYVNLWIAYSAKKPGNLTLTISKEFSIGQILTATFLNLDCRYMWEDRLNVPANES
jgi:hypothetical protein